jgi:hypothetical protein
MQLTLRPYVTAGIALTGAGLIAVTPIAAPHLIDGQTRAVALTAGPSDNAFTIDGTTFDPGGDGYNTFGPLAPLAPLLEIGSGSTGIGQSALPTQPLEVYDNGTDVGTAHTSTTAADILGLDSAQFTVQSIAPPVTEVQDALSSSGLDFSGAGLNVSDLANALTASGFNAIPYGTDITGSDVFSALVGAGIVIPGSAPVSDADIAGVLNGIDVSDLPDVGTVYSFTNLGSGWANVYEAVPNADGTAASQITDTLVTPFGNFDIPTSYDAVAHLDPGAAFTGLAATSDNSDLSDNAFTIDNTTFDPGSAGFTQQFPLFSSAPLLELAGGQVRGATLAGQNLEVFDGGGSDLGNIATSMNTQNLLGIDSTQLTVTGDNLPISDAASALSASSIDFSGLDTTAADVANALGPISLSGGPLAGFAIFGQLIGAVPNLSLSDATDIANVLNSAIADYTPSADLPADGTVYSVTNLGSGWENVYVATPNSDGTAAASITDTFITPYGNVNIPTSYDAIAPIDAGAPFAGLHVASDASGLSANAFTIDGTTFDPGSAGFTPVHALTGNAPLLEVGGGFVAGAATATQDLDVFGGSGTELGSIDTDVTTANIFGLIDTTQLNVAGYNVPPADFVTALDSSDINFTGAGFTASDLVNILENPAFIAINLGSGDVTGTDVTNALLGSDINLSAAGIDPDAVASAINGETDAYSADLPDLGTVYSVTDFGGGFENVYEAVPNADGTAAATGGITDYLVTPFGNVDLSTMFDAIAQLDPGDAAAGVSVAGSAAAGDTAASGFELFDPSTWF